MKKNKVFVIALIILFVSIFFIYKKEGSDKIKVNSNSSSPVILAPTELYNGPIENIFFHSLLIYPALIEKAGPAKKELINNNMITVSQFNKILIQIYENNFILIDPHLIYKINSAGQLEYQKLYLPKGKKPLILFIDDLNYYSDNETLGFANKLIIDNQGKLSNVFLDLNGQKQISQEVDIVPIIENFVSVHPDFSLNGFKGIIALTGYEGVLGYRTQAGSLNQQNEINDVMPVIEKLKNNGWLFANHSYRHGLNFFKGTITEDELRSDLDQWRDEVQPLVGDTDIFVGPFGQIFKPNDKRRQIILDYGFESLFGVGLYYYENLFPNYISFDRIDVDGYRLKNNEKVLFDRLGIKP